MAGQIPKFLNNDCSIDLKPKNRVKERNFQNNNYQSFR